MALAVVSALVAVAWASDWVTLQNERTVYTADCERGTWQGAHCGGKLVAGPRYRFRALRTHGEVLFWTVGSAEPSGRLAPCVIDNGRNWSCQPSAEAARTVTLNMVLGQPGAGGAGATKPYHAVSKWQWWLLRQGIPLGQDAMN